MGKLSVETTGGMSFDPREAGVLHTQLQLDCLDSVADFSVQAARLARALMEHGHQFEFGFIDLEEGKSSMLYRFSKEAEEADQAALELNELLPAYRPEVLTVHWSSEDEEWSRVWQWEGGVYSESAYPEEQG